MIFIADIEIKKIKKKKAEYIIELVDLRIQKLLFLYILEKKLKIGDSGIKKLQGFFFFKSSPNLLFKPFFLDIMV